MMFDKTDFRQKVAQKERKGKGRRIETEGSSQTLRSDIKQKGGLLRPPFCSIFALQLFLLVL
jgi:hypothetical protein